MGVIDNLFGQVADQSAEQTLGFSMMAAAGASAGAYLAATLAATTPELRSILSGFLGQKVVEHETLTSYIIEKGWMNPYDNPIQRLEGTFEQANALLSQQ